MRQLAFSLPGTPPAMPRPFLLGLATIAFLASLPGCGGSDSSFGGGPVTTPEAQAQNAAVATRPQTAAAVASPPGAKPDAVPSQATGPSRYDVRLYDEDGRAAPTFELAPTEGRGYPAVSVLVVLRGARVISPVANVQAYCATPTRCEYRPPHNGDHALKYTVSIAEDSIARLNPVKDMITVTTRELKVAEPFIVTVTLTVEGQPPAARQIKYLRSPG